MSLAGCTNPVCVDPEEIGCNRGNPSFIECPFYQRQHIGEEAEAENVSETRETSVLRLPWTGNSFGIRDIELIASAARPTLIGVIGPYNAGKTTLLALIYLLLEAGRLSETGFFAGSRSLVGWSHIVNNLRWGGENGAPHFPPHTSRNAGRVPGVLHVGFRHKARERQEFLITDPPGEWFSKWAEIRDSPGSEGARWIGRHADRFVFLADSEALSSPERGQSRDRLRDLARRRGAERRMRAVAVVWTKSDIAVPAPIEEALTECFSQCFPNHRTFRVQVPSAGGATSAVQEPFISLAQWMFAPADERGRSLPLTLDVIPEVGDDPWLSFRGRDKRR